MEWAALLSRDAEDHIGLALAKRQVPFGQFHRRRLACFAGDLRHVLAAWPSPMPVDVETVVEEAVGDLLEELSILAGRTLVSVFHEFRRDQELPADPTQRAAFQLFEAHVGEPEVRQGVSDRYPVLDMLLDGAVQHRLALLAEVLDAAAADWQALTDLGIAPDGPLTRIGISSGDAHNGGRRVAILTCRAGQLVYKPRSLAGDAALAAAAARLSPYLEHGCALRLPTILLRPSHGWQEHVSAVSMTDFAQVRRHRYRLGAFLALFAALGSTDLHHENVIAVGEHPMFIDLETVLQHHAGGEPDGQQTGSALASPLLSTMLLPMRVAGLSLDVDLSGIGTAEIQTSSLASFSVLDPATDAMRFERATFEVSHSANLARIGDLPVPPDLFADDVVLGFSDAIGGIRDLGPALLDHFAEQQPVMRQVIRPTHVYGRFLAASTHPRYLATPADRRRLLSRIAPAKGMGKQAALRVGVLELTALERHDIPYFQVNLEGRDLSAPLDGSVQDAYPATLLDRTRASLAGLLSTPLLQHEHTIRMCLATAVPSPPLSPIDARPSPGGYLTDQLVDGGPPVAGAIGSVLRQTAMPAGAGGQQAWLTPSVEGTATAAGLLFRLGDTTLYEGGGIPLLLAGLSAHEDSPHWADLALAALPPDLAMAEPQTPRGLSLFSGLAGGAYLMHELGTLLRDQSLLARRDSLLLEVLRTPVTPEHEVDVVGGVSATAAYAVSLAQFAPHLPVQDFVEAGIARMVQALSGVARADGRTAGAGGLSSGELAHGDLGVAWCLARCAAAMNDHAALSLAERVLTRQVERLHAAVPQTRPLLAQASWCKGTAGSLIALSEGLLLVGWARHEVGEVVGLLVAQGQAQLAGRGRDLSPCHGATGMVQALLRAGQVLDRPDLVREARSVLAQRRTLVRRDGYTGGLAVSQGFLGYMLGLTGVGHTELLLDHPQWGIPLALTPHGEAVA